jgi:predicted transposase/invertase (TIGR01784 family)
MAFLKLTSDFIFKKLFTESPELLADLVNSVLNLNSEFKIVSLEVLNPEIPKEIISDKTSILDIRAKDKFGNIYNIEMQAFPKSAFIKRALFYWSKLYSGQLDKGDPYSKLRAVYSINFLDYSIVNISKYHTQFFLLEKDYPDVQLSEDMEIHIIELPKFQKKLDEIRDNLDLWVYTIKESNRLKEDEMKIIVDKNPKMEKAFDQLEEYSRDKKLRDEYEHRLMEETTYKSALQENFEKGIEKGIEKGMEKTIFNMHNKGYAIAAIKEITSLSEERILEIIKKKNQ